jgi:hypothetical protein
MVFHETTVDLADKAEQLREQAAELRDEREQLVADATAEYDGPADAPDDVHDEFADLREAEKAALETAAKYERCVDAWGGGEFTLRELNTDEFAATLDAVSAEAANQRREDGDLPDGYGKKKSLEYGVKSKPPDAPADPGEWPPAVTNELWTELNALSTPDEVDLGNASLAAAMDDAS